VAVSCLSTGIASVDLALEFVNEIESAQQEEDALRTCRVLVLLESDFSTPKSSPNSFSANI
jgi:hypothetical protein